MTDTWKRYVMWIALTVSIGATQSTTQSATQLAAKFDAEAYVGLLGARDKEETLTRSPRDLTVSVSDLEQPLRHDDGRRALPADLRMITMAACRADLIVTARPVNEEPFLNPAETWIFTRYQLQTLEVIKPQGSLADADQKLTYVHPSGAMTLQGLSTSTVVTNYPRLEVGQDYMFFLRRIPDTGHYSSVLDIPVLVGGTKWTPHVKSDVQMPRELRAGMSQGGIIAQVVGAHCKGNK